MKYGILFTLFFSLAVYADDFPIEIDSNVVHFVSKHKESGFKNHRSSLQNSEEANISNVSVKVPGFIADLEDEPGLSKCSSSKWKNGFDSEFLVKFEDPTNEFEELIKSSLKPYGIDTFRYSMNDNEFYLERKDFIYNKMGVLDIVGETLDTNDLLKIANHIVDKIGIFKGRLEFSNFECGYLNENLHVVNIRYRRLFRNGIVLDNVSYFYLKLDATGKLISASGKWPRFIPLAAASEAIDMNTGVELTKKWYRGNFSKVTIKNAEDTPPIKAKIEGIALGWKCLESEKEIIISPHYAFKTDVTLKDGNKLPHFFYCPRLKKYI